MVGIGSALPEQIVTNKQFESYLDTTDEWIVRRRASASGAISTAP